MDTSRSESQRPPESRPLAEKRPAVPLVSHAKVESAARCHSPRRKPTQTPAQPLGWLPADLCRRQGPSCSSLRSIPAPCLERQPTPARDRQRTSPHSTLPMHYKSSRWHFAGEPTENGPTSS